MRQSLVYGTATTLLLTVAMLPAYAEEAYAGSTVMAARLDTADELLYGATPPDLDRPSVTKEISEMSALATLGASSVVGGAALVAAGVALARHWHEGDPDGGAETDPSNPSNASEQVGESDTGDA